MRRARRIAFGRKGFRDDEFDNAGVDANNNEDNESHDVRYVK